VVATFSIFALFLFNYPQIAIKPSEPTLEANNLKETNIEPTEPINDTKILPAPSVKINDKTSTSATFSSHSVGKENSVIADSIKPTIVICSQPFLVKYTSLPATLNFSIYFLNSLNYELENSQLEVKLDNKTLEITSISYNSTSQLYDVSVKLPAEEIGKYMLRALYKSEEAHNFKGVNIYQHNGNFTFIHLTDTHLDLPDFGFEYQFNKTIEMIKKSDPDFVISTGDLSTNNHQRFYSILKAYDFKIPIFCVNGNHEKEGERVLENSVAYMAEKKTAFFYEYPTSFNFGDYHFVGLDTGIFPYASYGNISDAQFSWFECDLRANQDKQLIVFGHHPLYFNGKTIFWANSSVAENIRNLCSTYGVKVALAGHTHKSDVTALDNVTYYTTVSAINVTHWIGPQPYSPAGFRIVQVVNDKIASTQVIETFSYYTGELILQPSNLTSKQAST